MMDLSDNWTLFALAAIAAGRIPDEAVELADEMVERVASRRLIKDIGEQAGTDAPVGVAPQRGEETK